LEEERWLEIEDLLKKHQEYCEETKTALLFSDMLSEKPAGEVREGNVLSAFLAEVGVMVVKGEVVQTSLVRK
jgi:hypothetical protein